MFALSTCWSYFSTNRVPDSNVNGRRDPMEAEGGMTPLKGSRGFAKGWLMEHSHRFQTLVTAILCCQFSGLELQITGWKNV